MAGPACEDQLWTCERWITAGAELRNWRLAGVRAEPQTLIRDFFLWRQKMPPCCLWAEIVNNCGSALTCRFVLFACYVFYKNIDVQIVRFHMQMQVCGFPWKMEALAIVGLLLSNLGHLQWGTPPPRPNLLPSGFLTPCLGHSFISLACLCWPVSLQR